MKDFFCYYIEHLIIGAMKMYMATHFAPYDSLSFLYSSFAI